MVNENFAYSLGRALSKYVEDRPKQTQKVLIGRDTRPSGKSLVIGLNRGLEDGGLRAFEAGILPTPALAFGVLDGSFDLGVMITASHNPSQDNGFKIFSGKGEKLTIQQEELIESQLDRTLVFLARKGVVSKNGIAYKDTSTDSRDSFPITFSRDSRSSPTWPTGPQAKRRPKYFLTLEPKYVQCTREKGPSTMVLARNTPNLCKN